MKKIIQQIVLIVPGLMLCITMFAQTPGLNGYNVPLQNQPNTSFGNGTLGPVYNVEKCGLNYVQASVRLGQRSPIGGAVQPATFTISGIPAGAIIEQAYLWADASGNGAAMTATVTNTSNLSGNYPMALVGSAADKCWGYQGSHTYRADVTSAVSGNGNYLISGLLTGTSNDVDGATLFIVYSNPASAVRGSLIIYDGAIELSGGNISATISGFTACSNATGAKAFCMIGDMQLNNTIVTMNGTIAPYVFNWWNFIEVNTAVAGGQTNSALNVNSVNDCINFCVAGLYYQTTVCATCSGCTFTCPANIIESSGINCTKSVTTPDPVFSNNCNPVTLTWALTGATTLSSPATGINYVGTKTFRTGTTTVTYTATDASNIVKTCSYTVKVTETVPPEIRCPLDKSVNADPGVCTRAVVSLGTPIVSDNCGVAFVTNNAPAIYQPGSNFVTWTVTDHSGNTRTCVQEIFVADNQKPTITCPANIIQSTGPVCEATLVNTANPFFSDNCAVVKLTWAMTGVSWGTSPNIGINYVGEKNFATGLSRITYAATDAAGNTQTCTFTVTVKDNTAPTLTCPTDQTLCKVAGNSYSIPVMIQTDNCDIAKTDFKVTGVTNRTGSGTNASGIFNLGVSTVAWTVKDVAGNVSNCSILVTVLPATHPDCNQPFANPTNLQGVNRKRITEATVPGLSLIAWPNPAQNFFNLKVNSQAKEAIEIRVFDMAGKLVHTNRGAPGDRYILGSNLVTGMYVIEVRQAGKTVRTKVVKN